MITWVIIVLGLAQITFTLWAIRAIRDGNRMHKLSSEVHLSTSRLNAVAAEAFNKLEKRVTRLEQKKIKK